MRLTCPPSTDTPRDPLRRRSASPEEAAKLCRKIAEGEAEESFVFAPISSSCERKVFIQATALEKGFQYIFIWLGVHLPWKVKRREKCSHTAPHTPIALPSQYEGHTYTHMGVSSTEYCCLQWPQDEFPRNPGVVLMVWNVSFSSPDKTKPPFSPPPFRRTRFHTSY